MKIKNTIAIILLSIASKALMACDLCKRNQPEMLKEITHGEGPSGSIDYIISWTAVVIVGITLLLSIKYLVKPNEQNKNHIKNIVIDEFR